MITNTLNKFCIRCEQIKLETDFNKNKGHKDGLHSFCKSCQKQYTKEHYQKNKERHDLQTKLWRKNNPEKALWINRKTKYGITPKQYNDFLIKQDNRCVICGALDSGTTFCKSFHIDHNHKTGNIRGLLCQACNHLIGNAKDNIQILESAISYLKSHS